MMNKLLSVMLAASMIRSSLVDVDQILSQSRQIMEGTVLNIWCWNEEFQRYFNDYYPDVESVSKDRSTTTLKNGITVKWTINPTLDNNYQNQLDEALMEQASAAADDKIDLFLLESDYALKYVSADADVALPLSELGITADDPDEVQAALSDWNKFNKVAAQAKDKGYYMLSGYYDSFRAFSNNVNKPWVEGTTVTVDSNIMAWIEQTKEFTDNGTIIKLHSGVIDGYRIKVQTQRYSVSSIRHGESISCWLVPPVKRVMVTGQYVRGHSLITGAGRGLPPRRERIIQHW